MLRCIQQDQAVYRIYRNRIRCVLAFENKLYLMLGVSNGDDVIFRCKWNYYHGFRYLEEEVPQNILAFARKMIELNAADAGRYPLKGEWYSIKAYSYHNRSGWHLRKMKKSTSTTCTVAISRLLHFALAMVFAGLILAWTRGCAKEWLHLLFPDLGRSVLGTVAVAVEYAGCILLYLLFHDQGDAFELYLNAFIPFGLIVVAGLLKCYWWMWLVIPAGICLTWFLAAVWIILVEEYEVTCCGCMRLSLAVLGVILFMITSLGGLNAYSHSGNTSDQIRMSMEEAQKQHGMECCNLENEIWNTLNTQEKIDLLQIISDYECEFVLGCEPVKVYSGLFDRKNVLGEYSDQTRSVVISEEHLKNGKAEDVVKTALHETRHAYQHSLVEMYFSLEAHMKDEHKNLFPFQQAKSFSEEFREYCSGEEDFYTYYAQDVEKDSREWAEKRMDEYYNTFIYPDR